MLCIYPFKVNTHTPWTVGSHLFCGARGRVWGSVPCSRASQSWYWGWRESCTFTPHIQVLPDWDSNSQPLDYESDSLTIRPGLPQVPQVRNLYCWAFWNSKHWICLQKLVFPGNVVFSHKAFGFLWETLHSCNKLAFSHKSIAFPQ